MSDEVKKSSGEENDDADLSSKGIRLLAGARSESTQQLTADMDELLDQESGGSSGQTGRGTSSRLTKRLLFAVAASTLGSSFQHGYNGGIVNAPQQLIDDFINATYARQHPGQAATDAQLDLIFALIVSVFCVGGCIGALLTAQVADRLGRKQGLFYNQALVLVACPLMYLARPLASYQLLILGRLIIGLNSGLNAGLASLYLNEISPMELRGALGTIYQLVITVSIFLANLLAMPSVLGTDQSWPLLFALPMLPAVAMQLALAQCPESPKFLLVNQGRELQAQQALAWFRDGSAGLELEMDELRCERQQLLVQTNADPLVTCSMGQMFKQRALRRPLIISVVIMLSQQLSGINAVLFFSTSIFRSAGLTERLAQGATLGMSMVNVLVTLGSLLLVERAGRRTLHMTGLAGMALASLVLALCLGGQADDETPPQQAGASGWLAVVSVYFYIAMFASGPGSIPWFIVSELFPSSARPLATSVAIAVNWLANFTVSLCFLPLTNLLHGHVFILFAILLLIFYLFTYYKVPETKGATAEEISALFKR